MGAGERRVWAAKCQPRTAGSYFRQRRQWAQSSHPPFKRTATSTAPKNQFLLRIPMMLLGTFRCINAMGCQMGVKPVELPGALSSRERNTGCCDETWYSEYRLADEHHCQQLPSCSVGLLAQNLCIYYVCRLMNCNQEKQAGQAHCG